jgi:predicted aconitase with swiveling domain
MEIRAHTVSPGQAQGPALIYNGPFSFLGDFNMATGEICVHGHPLEGKRLNQSIFVFTTGKGSSGGDFAAWIAKTNNTLPAGIICLESEPVLTGAALITQIPMVDRPEGDIFELIHAGDALRLDATNGLIFIATDKACALG